MLKIRMQNQLIYLDIRSAVLVNETFNYDLRFNYTLLEKCVLKLDLLYGHKSLSMKTGS